MEKKQFENNNYYPEDPMYFDVLSVIDKKMECKHFLELAGQLPTLDSIALLTKLVRANTQFAFKTDIESASRGEVNCVGSAITTAKLLREFGIDAKIVTVPRWPWFTINSSIHFAILCDLGKNIVLTDATAGSGYGYGKTSGIIPKEEISNKDGKCVINGFVDMSYSSFENYVYPEFIVQSEDVITSIQYLWLAETALSEGKLSKAIKYLGLVSIDNLPESYLKKYELLVVRVKLFNGNKSDAYFELIKCLTTRPCNPTDWKLLDELYGGVQIPNYLLELRKKTNDDYITCNVAAKRVFDEISASLLPGYKKAYYQSCSWWRSYKVDKNRVDFPTIEISGYKFEVEKLNPCTFESEGIHSVSSEDGLHLELQPKGTKQVSPIYDYERSFLSMFPQWLASDLYNQEL